MLKRIRQRLGGESEHGSMSLIEVLIVVIIIGILLAIAVPSYIEFRDRANDNAAKANVWGALPAVRAFYSDNGTYAGMTLATLQDLDRHVKLDGDPTVTETTYCLESSVHGKVWKISGPGTTTPVSGSCR